MILPLVLLLTSSRVILSISTELIQPAILDADLTASTNESIVLDLDWTTIDPGFEGSAFETRSLGGSVPGPTVKISAGETLRVRFRNLLDAQPGSVRSGLNKHKDPDTANLHFHGGHVSSVSPSDDSDLEVGPGGATFDYVVHFPNDHAPGLHWVHPHHHGSGAIHVAGGAALALIVKDPPGSLPPQIEAAEDRLLIFQYWAVPDMIKMAAVAGDSRGRKNLELIEGGEEMGQRFLTVNGMYLPSVTLRRGEWERWRILYAGWQDLPLNLKPFIPVGDESANDRNNCEFQLLAKDGIYIRDYPRLITDGFPIPAGGRADVMVRCHRNTTGISFKAMDRLVMTLVVTSSTEQGQATDTHQAVAPKTQPLDPWAPAGFPGYLQSTIDSAVTPGCTCETKMEGYDETGRINDKLWLPGNRFMHTSFLGAVIERRLRGMHEHSYHQHIYPFQLVSGFDDTEYFKTGDWHDVFMDESQQGPFVVRYRTTKFAGKMMVHCHNVQHADRGMLAKEYVRDIANGECTCDTFEAVSGAGVVDDNLDPPSPPQQSDNFSSGGGRNGKLTIFLQTAIAAIYSFCSIGLV